MIYIVYNNLYGEAFGNGIRRKILGQIKTFERFFGKVYHTCYMGQMMYLFDGEIPIEKEFALTKRECNQILCTWLEKYKIKRTYIRYAFADQWFLRFLKYQKQKGIKSVIEIPTYPYDGEGIRERTKIEDAYYRKSLHRYMELITTNSEESEIWGIRCVPMLNGIDIEDYPLCVKEQKREGIVLIAVSTLVFWQGYERVIEGIHEYYQAGGTCELYFKIVGEGPEKSNYQKLVQMYDLQDRVEFCGSLDGKELDRQYALSDIAVSSLGRYQSKVQDITPIKAAEYCARGIPFICGYHDLRFTGSEKYILNIPNHSQPVQMNQVIDFYQELSKYKDYQEEMRRYADGHLRWETVLKPVLEYLEGKEPAGRKSIKMEDANAGEWEDFIDVYADELAIAQCSFEIMGKLLETSNLKKKMDDRNLKKLYIYGGGYLGIQFYRACSNVAEIPAVVDRKGRLQSDVTDIPVIGMEQFRKIYKKETIVIASVKYYQEIRRELLSFVPENRLLFLGEFLDGIL